MSDLKCNYCYKNLSKNNYSPILYECYNCSIDYWIKKNKVYRTNIFLREGSLCLVAFEYGKTYLQEVNYDKSYVKKIINLPEFFIKEKKLDVIKNKVYKYITFL